MGGYSWWLLFLAFSAACSARSILAMVGTLGLFRPCSMRLRVSGRMPAPGQLDLRQAKLAAGAKDVPGLDHSQRYEGWIVAAGVRGGQIRFPQVRLAQSAS